MFRLAVVLLTISPVTVVDSCSCSGSSADKDTFVDNPPLVDSDPEPTDTAHLPLPDAADGMFADTDPDDWRVVVIGNFPNELTGSSCGLGDDVCYDCFHEPTRTYARWYRQEVPDGGYLNDLWFEDSMGVLVFDEWNPSDGTGILADGTGFQAIRDVCVPMVWRYHD